jgi:hypothetical protein
MRKEFNTQVTTRRYCLTCKTWIVGKDKLNIKKMVSEHNRKMHRNFKVMEDKDKLSCRIIFNCGCRIRISNNSYGYENFCEAHKSSNIHNLLEYAGLKFY